MISESFFEFALHMFTAYVWDVQRDKTGVNFEPKSKPNILCVYSEITGDLTIYKSDLQTGSFLCELHSTYGGYYSVNFTIYY